MQSESADGKPDLDLEIAYVLLVDIVGYSKLLVNEQVQQLKMLNTLVRATPRFRAEEATGKLIRLPTGDGMALLFSHSPEDPVRCALEISKALQEHAQLRLRMGVHSGPVNQVLDVNDQRNVAGAGINIAQRVMDCGDAGHILLSGHVADDLAQYSHWQPFLHDLGQCEVKHGLHLQIVNLFKDGLGNPAVPERLRRRGRWRKKSGETHAITPPRFPGRIFAGVVALALVMAAFSLWLVFHRPFFASDQAAPGTASLPIPEKSIAVLPFENLGSEKEDAYFADGIQDEILTDLAKLADLKVISRTSVMQYREDRRRRNLREIARALGVSYALEGSLQRNKDRVRVSAQLIDARTDAHVWGEHYDRPVADIFAIQSEVAEKIVEQLRVKLSPREKEEIEQEPTKDLVAFDLYVRGKELIQNSVFTSFGETQLFEAVQTLEKAIARDPQFALAYYELAHAHDQLYFTGADHTQQRIKLAEKSIASLHQLRPESGEAHLAAAKHAYWCHRAYDKARDELAKARAVLPNEQLVYLLSGYLDRRQSRWNEAISSFDRAIVLDPRNSFLFHQAALTFRLLRRYDEAAALLDRARQMAPSDTALRVERARIEFEAKANTKPLHDEVDRILQERPQEIDQISDIWLYLALAERDVPAAERALVSLTEDGCRQEGIPFPREWCVAQVAQLKGDAVGAAAALASARGKLEQQVADQPEYAEAYCALGVVEAVLHAKGAVAHGQRALALLSPQQDSIIGPLLMIHMSKIYADCGQFDAALAELEKTLQIPGYACYGDLRLDAGWDVFRSEPRFEKLLASLAPKQ